MIKKYDLSVLITARNEEFLSRTVEGVLNNRRGNTEVIVVLDGGWTNPPIKDHEDVTILYHSESVGQRQGINEAASLSQAKYIMKLDAHCIMDEGFDVKLMADCEYDWTVVPRLYNLHAFNWKCKKCGNEWYQGPTPKFCCTDDQGKKQNPACDSKDFERSMIWKPRLNKRSDHMRFDRDLKFGYWGSFKDREEGKTDISPTLGLLGACFFLHRKRYWDIGGCDEKLGSWGTQGSEMSLKSWLSGGKLVVNKKTWYSHLFRTQGGDFGFPYPQSGNQVSRAKKIVQDNFFNNKWNKQIYPLSDLIEAFWPIPGWDQKDLDRVKKLGSTFKASDSFTNKADSFISSPMLSNSSIAGSSEMSISTNVSSGGKHIAGVSNKSEVVGIATPSISTDVINFHSSTRDGSNKPGISEHMNSNFSSIDSTKPLSIIIKKSSISGMINDAGPIPTTSNITEGNIREKSSDSVGGKLGNGQSLSHGNNIQQNTDISKGIIYYTDNKLCLKIAHRCKDQIKSIGLPIVSCSLKPMDNMGKNIHLKLKRGYLAYFKQILTALEASEADIIYFCEHDVLYHKSHFDFTPEKKDVYYYDTNFWRVRSTDGHAITYDTCQVNFICAYRDLLIQNYRERIKRIEALGNVSDREIGSLARKMGFEPGTHNREERVDNYKAEKYHSEYPSLDIRHGNNLTASRWSKEQFRDQRNCRGWKETKNIPGWGEFKDFFGLID